MGMVYAVCSVQLFTLRFLPALSGKGKKRNLFKVVIKKKTNAQTIPYRNLEPIAMVWNESDWQCKTFRRVLRVSCVRLCDVRCAHESRRKLSGPESSMEERSYLSCERSMKTKNRKSNIMDSTMGNHQPWAI